jgi:hypothetical protein
MSNHAAASICDEKQAARWLAAWDSHGAHRTATAGDDAGLEWLVAEVRAVGASVSIEEFGLDRLDPIMTFLEIGGERIEGVPVFDAPVTDQTGVVGRLGLADSDCEIAVAELPARAVYAEEYERLRRTSTHRGLVIVCTGEAPGLGLNNAEKFRSPYGVPAIHVSSEARDVVLALATQGAMGRLVAEGRRIRAIGRNLVIEIPGAEPGRPPLVVMTPRSSWWQSVSERGGGVVCWLESLRAILVGSPARPVVFTANTGHELGLLGFEDFVARRPGCDRLREAGGATWLLYGANIGAAGGTLSVMSPADDLREAATAVLSRVGQPHILAPKERVPNGETRDLHRAGAHCLAINGTNRLFHLPQDRWPHAVDVPAITRIAAAGTRLAAALTR